ncbi:hypothetical protein CK486_03050 [Pseudomonas sp. HAR-UPW-AIA-41]|uniref:DUF6160 family protein n=1 Tax=Pseudomonas sp. HAR-UPW-AIA-41 TaxID=1985301 RepID=UPI000BB31555|nr:DUF6160 family protein [Pseudomonas sp. HAR-UPW-AIA-41]PAV49759.1 hypothetical protein CK486_03050 [Pseudomonas sp. HAR-UPW-AIA-41]
MKSFKQLALAAAVLSTSFMAQAQMKSMEDAALSDVTGQAGISISGNFNQTIGSVTYTDTDTGGGSIRMETIALTGFNISDANPVMIDVVNNGSVDQIQITMPTITGGMSIGAIKVGGASAASIGSLAINDLNMAGTTIKIWGH